jgi:hypothetical protein
MQVSKIETIKVHLIIAKLHNNIEAIKKHEAELAELQKPKITEITCDQIFSK